MSRVTVLAKVKFDLRNPDEAYFAQHEIEAILGTKVRPVRTIPALFRNYPFSEFSEEIVQMVTRHLYLGEIQGYLASVKSVNANKLIFQPALFREIFLIIEAAEAKDEERIKQSLPLTDENLYRIFKVDLENGRKIFVVRLLPLHALFEYVTDVRKLPAVAVTPRDKRDWRRYFTEKEEGIEKGLDELLEHLRNNYCRAPHFGLGKQHIGDFIDWVFTDLRKPFLHYLHKYKGKGDPRMSRALINLLRVSEGDTILDPFAGSGTFIADAPTMGLNAIGVEILELGKLISEVKCNLDYDIKDLKDEIVNFLSDIDYSDYDLFSFGVNDKVEKAKARLKQLVNGGKVYANILPHLQKIICLKDRIEQVQNERVRKLLLVLLSQKIVEFSEKKRANNFIVSFKNYVEDRYFALYATLKLAEKLGVDISSGAVKVVKTDATQLDFIDDGSIDGILTSPPYFDALDYVGNNKASIIVLGLDEDLKFGSTKEYYSEFRKCDLKLPDSAINLIKLLEKSERSVKARTVEGYLKMMKLSFRECYRVLKPGKLYAMVVSKYHRWVINGEEQRVETSKILADLGMSEGFKLAKVIQHGLSKADKGKINVEDILLFQK